jgi:cytochrome c oxidase subunit 4
MSTRAPDTSAHEHIADTDEPKSTVRTYLIIFAALMVLLVVTVAVAFVHLGPLNIFIAMGIASIKAVLVILYFMHVKYSSKLTMVFASAAFFWLIVLFGLTFGDYVTRPWLQNSAGWDENPVLVKEREFERQVAEGEINPRELSGGSAGH